MRIKPKHFGVDDHTDIPSNDFTPLPPGDYVAEIEDVRGDEAKTGTKFLEITLVIKDRSYKGRKVWDRIFLTPKAWPRMVNLCKAARVYADAMTGEYEDVTELEGRRVMVNLDLDEYDGKTRNVVSFDGYRAAETTYEGHGPSHSDHTVDVHPPPPPVHDEEDDDLPF